MVDVDAISSSGVVSIWGDEEVSELEFAVGVLNTVANEASGVMGEWSSICNFWDDKDVLESSSLGDELPSENSGDNEEDN